MNEVFIVFATDAWISFDSYRLKEVFKSLEGAIGFIADIMGVEFTDDDWTMLSWYLQTQGHETNYIIERRELND